VSCDLLFNGTGRKTASTILAPAGTWTAETTDDGKMRISFISQGIGGAQCEDVNVPLNVFLSVTDASRGARADLTDSSLPKVIAKYGSPSHPASHGGYGNLPKPENA